MTDNFRFFSFFAPFALFCGYSVRSRRWRSLPAFSALSGVGIVPPFYEPVKLWFGLLQ